MLPEEAGEMGSAAEQQAVTDCRAGDQSVMLRDGLREVLDQELALVVQIQEMQALVRDALRRRAWADFEGFQETLARFGAEFEDLDRERLDIFGRLQDAMLSGVSEVYPQVHLDVPYLSPVAGDESAPCLVDADADAQSVDAFIDVAPDGATPDTFAGATVLAGSPALADAPALADDPAQGDGPALADSPAPRDSPSPDPHHLAWSFYALVSRFPPEERAGISALYRELGHRCRRVRFDNDSLLRYLTEARALAKEFLDAAFPDRRGGLYTRQGLFRQADMRSLVLDRQL